MDLTSNLRRLPLLTAALLVAACGDDGTAASDSAGSDAEAGSGSITDTAMTDSVSASDTANTESAGSMSDTLGTESGGSMTATTTTTDASTTTESDSDASSSDSMTTADPTTDPTASGTAGSTGTTGGPVIPVPNEHPGVEVGLCAPPGQSRYCYTGAPATYNIGACAPGIQQCIADDLDFGHWGDCENETLPGAEVCDGIDNDCDGEVDEDQGMTTCGMGVCMHAEPNCVNGIVNDCDPFDGAFNEICNDLDDDCDGMIDEGLGDQTIFCGVGVCYHSVTACVDGQEPFCDPFEGATGEVCDLLDNDCDGETDEGLGDTTCGSGVCENTVDNCINGVPQVCQPLPGSTEICNGIDDDCDGDVDEDQGTWTCGIDACEVTVPQCINGVPQPPSTCVPIPGGSEICGNGIDDNCDGEAPPCAESFLVGTDTDVRPIDVIWAVDSSGSMSQEMATVEAEINAFAADLAASGSSTQLILIADQGTQSFEICVEPPLGGGVAGNCADDPPNGFTHLDTNGGTNQAEFIHSSNALGRIVQQSGTWSGLLQPNSFLAVIVTSDDDGDDPEWVTPGDGLTADDSGVDDCNSFGVINDGSTTNICLFDHPNGNTYTSMAYDINGRRGFSSFMQDIFPTRAPESDWLFYATISSTGTSVLTGADDVYEFDCGAATAETGDEYVKLAVLTNTQDQMIRICDVDWPLDQLASDILSGIPNDTFILDGSQGNNCGQIDETTITVVVNGIPLVPADWTYDAGTCTLQILNNVPVIGDNVVIVYEDL